MLYNIIKQLQETTSTNDKLEIMKANKDNELFKEYNIPNSDLVGMLFVTKQGYTLKVLEVVNRKNILCKFMETSNTITCTLHLEKILLSIAQSNQHTQL